MKQAKLLRVDYYNTSTNGNSQYRGQFLFDGELIEIYGGANSCWNTPLRNLEGKNVLVDYKISRNKYVIKDIKEVK